MSIIPHLTARICPINRLLPRSSRITFNTTMAQSKSALVICIDDPQGPQFKDTDTDDLDPDDCVSTIVLVNDSFDDGRTRAFDIKCTFRKRYEGFTAQVSWIQAPSAQRQTCNSAPVTWQDSAGLAGPDGVNKSDLADATDLSKDSITKAVRDSVSSMGNLVDCAVLVERDVYEELYPKLYDTMGDSSVTKKDVVIPNHLEMPFGELQSWVMKGETLTIDSVETNV